MTANQTTFGFGSAAPTFGTAANTQSQAGTLFGAGASNNTSAGTLFGANTSNSSAAGTLFGGSATSTTAPSGFGGFNKPATTNAFGTSTSQPAAAATTGFGGFGTPATSTAGFGATANTGFGSAATSTAGGFGSTTTPAASGGFGGFGATATSTAGTGFGQPAQTPALNFNLPASTTPAQPFTFGPAKSPFGAVNNNLSQITTGFGQQQTGFGVQQQQQQQQMGAAPVQEKVWQDLALIRAHFDPTSPLCQFKHYFYNMVPTNEAHLYVRPQNQDEQLWNEAVRKNPDPTCLVPVLAIGFDDILKRMEIQSKQVELHQEKLKETAERLTTVQRQYALGTLVKLEEHKRRHTDLTQRLLRLLRYSQVLRYKGFPLNADEEHSMIKLDQLNAEPDNPENLHAKMLVLWNQLQHIKAKRNMDSSDVWRTVRNEDTEVIAKVLEDEQMGIMHVASILKSDTKELEVIEVGLRDSRSRMN